MATRKGKKTNNLTENECETILFKLETHKDSKYYKDVLKQLERLKKKNIK
jgi:hypothetical protein